MATSTDIKADTKQHLSDMVALDEHILEAVTHQLGVDKVKEDADALALLTRTQAMYARHIEQMKTMVELQDAETRTSLKSILTSFLGDIAGLYNHMRTAGAARAIRDTYTALNLTSASLTALKTFGLIVGKEPISKLAYEQMRDLFPLIMEFNKRLPYVVARETAAALKVPFNSAVPERVENATQRIWNGKD
jgi:hypothetical protein